jgi:YidC/Oxa1 family membrane protein insertase
VLSLFDPAVHLLHSVVLALSGLLDPSLHGQSVAVALVLTTLAVRAALVPLSVRVLRAERSRAALAPELARLRARYGKDRRRLGEELLAAHRRAGTGPLAGAGAALAQAPVLLTVYLLCRTPVIGGTANAVLGGSLGGLPLAIHLPFVLSAGPVAVLTAAVLLAALLAVAVASSRQGTARARAAGVEGAMLLPARLLPYGLLVTAAVVPVAVSLYLLTSTTWSVLERAVLPRLV